MDCRSADRVACRRHAPATMGTAQFSAVTDQYEVPISPIANCAGQWGLQPMRVAMRLMPSITDRDTEFDRSSQNGQTRSGHARPGR
jgi:hypothetical protein